jgi:uncharacterized protein (TIGR03437 family)
MLSRQNQHDNERHAARSPRRRMWPLVLCAVIFTAAGLAALPSVPQGGEPARQHALTAPDKVAEARLVESYGKLPLSFEANRGQAAPEVKFISRGQGADLFLTPTEAALELRGRATEKGSERRVTLKMKLVGARAEARVSGEEQLPGTTNYFIGDDPKEWRTDVPTFARVKYEGVYEGVDLVYYGNRQQLEYDFVVQPGAQPEDIRLGIEGAQEMRIDAATGDLVLETEAGEVRQHRPVAYQEVGGRREEVAAGYNLGAGGVAFEVGAYDEALPLVIDPVLSYATFLGKGPGGESQNGWSTHGLDVAVDKDGNAVVVGQVAAPDFPVKGGIKPRALDSDNYLAFVTKFNANGSGLIYSAVLGGPPAAFQEHIAHAVAVDDEGNAYVAGYTTGQGFPKTSGAFSSGGKIFVSKLNPTGTQLIFSTLLGGGSYEEAKGVAVDRDQNVYVTGLTMGFPASPDAFQKEPAGHSDAFVIKLSADASRVIYATYLGGGVDDVGESIAVDAAGCAYVSGTGSGTHDGPRTDYKPFPTTPGAFRTLPDPALPNGGVFVAKLNPTGSALVYSTVIGAGGGGELALDGDGCVYVAGVTGSNDFPTTPGAFMRRGGTEDVHNPKGDGFVAKLSADGSRLIYSTFLGAAWGNVRLFDVAVDAAGCAYATGSPLDPGFPFTTAYAPAPPMPGFSNRPGGGFVTKLKADGSGLVYSAYIPHARGQAVAVDAAGNAYVAGEAWNLFPATDGAYQGYYLNADARGVHAFAAKIASASTPEPLLPPEYPVPLTEEPNSTYSFHVGGRIQDALGRPVEGATVAIVGTGVAASWLARQETKDVWKIAADGTITATAVSDRGGYYRAPGMFPPGANYTFTPSKPGHTFDPPGVTIERLGRSRTVSFVATSSLPSRTFVNVSAAHYRSELAYDGIVTAFGYDLATATDAATALPLPTKLGGTTVKVRDVTGVERLAPLFFVSPTQINYAIPTGTFRGRALVTVTNSAGVGASEVIEVEDTAPGLFTVDASGRGIAAAGVQRVRADGSQVVEQVMHFDRARNEVVPLPIDLGPEGDRVYLLLFGTGLRHRRRLEVVGARISGIEVPVAYAGAQGNFVGLDQVNLLLPRSLAGRGAVDIALSIDGKPANVVQVKIK